jgi:hypothetical protein
VSTVDGVIDVLHAAGMPGFTYDPAVDAPIAVVHAGGGLGGCDFWWASCKPCWWWDEDEPDHRTAFTPAEAQVRADAHNRIHHPTKETP